MPDLPIDDQDKTITSLPQNTAGDALHQHDLIDGVYEIERELGAGGAGSVYQVKQRLLGHSFAMKILHDTYSETTMLRFLKEAQIAADLDHPNLVRAFHSGVLPNGKPYYVMDLVSGRTLAEHLEKGPLRPPEVINIFLPLCLALDYAHARGLVHRDIKPGNTVLTIEAGKVVPKIIDFGIAHLALSEGNKTVGLTRTGEIFGTPKYMSPEQCLSKKVDQRSDIYSLGCMLYECLTGKVPFVGENAVATSMLHVTTPPQALRDALPSRQFVRGWQEIIDQMLAKDPAERFQSCAQVAHALEAVRDNTVELPIKRKTVTPPAPPKTTRVKSILIAAIIGGVLLVTAGGAALFMHGNSSNIDPRVATASSAERSTFNPYAYGNVIPRSGKPPKPAENALEGTAKIFPYSERLFNKAIAAAQKGDWLNAMSDCKRSLDDLKKSARPEDDAALSLRYAVTGLALANLGSDANQHNRLIGASTYMGWAIRQNPYVGQYYAIRSKFYSALGQGEAAAADSEDAKKLASAPTECDRVMRKITESKITVDERVGEGDGSTTKYLAAKKMLTDGQWTNAAQAFKKLLLSELAAAKQTHSIPDMKRCSFYLALIAYPLYRSSETIQKKSLLTAALSEIETAISYNKEPAEFYRIKSIILKKMGDADKAQECDDIFVEKNRDNADPQINDELRAIVEDLESKAK